MLGQRIRHYVVILMDKQPPHFTHSANNITDLANKRKQVVGRRNITTDQIASVHTVREHQHMGKTLIPGH